MKKILIRIDDICPTMNWAKWQLAKDALDHYDIKPVIGVIPDNQDPTLMIDSPKEDFWDYIKSLQDKGYKIGMHGYHHTYKSHGPGIAYKRKTSEFANLPYNTQLEMIQKGKKIFESHGISTDLFFAPGHSYDENTLKALSECGFRYLLDGMSYQPLTREGIISIPCRNTGCPRKIGSGYSTVVFHTHEWSRPDKKDAEKRFTDLLEKENQNIVSFDEYVLRPCGIGFIEKMDESLYSFYFYRIKPCLAKVKQLLKMQEKKWK